MSQQALLLKSLVGGPEWIKIRCKKQLTTIYWPKWGSFRYETEFEHIDEAGTTYRIWDHDVTDGLIYVFYTTKMNATQPPTSDGEGLIAVYKKT